jgi:hypothetical protein
VAAYYTAAVCRRGHVETPAVEYHGEEVAPYCSTCGQPILTACPDCETPLRGRPEGWILASWDPSDFCYRCGHPFPWVSREGRVELLLTQLENADLPEAERLRAREQLEALRDPELGDQEQARLWSRFKQLAPTVWNSDAAQNVIGSLIEAGVRGLIR